ncbi:hypothetical protein [Nocardia flavorosea]|uniref:Uncharacterized protein n=1 Tax=Nocardia flavorosea TaxID=53429 RepID=A0A846Y6Z9_9NOCA|nr:hypothetical protein [Nocardia flavorosea]NKY54973.1 hypothetical protein [Nocardia flavorosea]
MANIEVDLDALRRASAKGADTRDAVESWTSRVVQILSRLPAACGSDDYARDFFEGSAGRPGIRTALEATTEGAGVMQRYAGDVYRAQSDQVDRFSAAEDVSSRSFG